MSIQKLQNQIGDILKVNGHRGSIFQCQTLMKLAYDLGREDFKQELLTKAEKGITPEKEFAKTTKLFLKTYARIAERWVHENSDSDEYVKLQEYATKKIKT